MQQMTTQDRVLMFSGQGSQRYGMGHELYRENRVFRAYLDIGEEIAREYLGGRSLLGEMLNHDRRLEPFDNTLVSTPALYVFQYAAARAAVFENGNRRSAPVALLGYSLGEFVAAALAGVYEFETGLKFILRYARLIHDLCPPAGMLAILDDVEIVRRHPEIFGATTIAGENYPGCFVVTGQPQELKELASFLDRIDIITQELPVARGYHSPWIDPAQAAIQNELTGMRFSSPGLPVYSCLLGRAVADGEYDANFFWSVVRRPIQFQQALAAALSEAAAGGQRTFYDLGPSGVMANFVKYSLSGDEGARFASAFNPFQGELQSWNAFLEIARPWQVAE
ncbi:MAG: acyltransferase domain-containing protein [Leptospirales bacterium]|jgi:bacillaene synthase trans-acting acyltransferase